MPERINSFGSIICPNVFVLLAAIAINFDSPAQAKDGCIDHPPQPVSEGTHRSAHSDYGACSSCHTTATEAPTWKARVDRASGRKCWFLVDAQGRDVTEAQGAQTAAPPPTQTFSSTLASLFSGFSFTGAPANAAPAGDAPASTSQDSSRKRQGDGADAKKTDSGVRVSVKNNSEGQAAKRVSQVSFSPEEQNLFAEFLRWREINKTLSQPGDEPRHEANR